MLRAASQGYFWLASTCTKERKDRKNNSASAGIVAALRSTSLSSRCTRHAGYEAAAGSGVGFGEATHGPRGARLCYCDGALADLGKGC